MSYCYILFEFFSTLWLSYRVVMAVWWYCSVWVKTNYGWFILVFRLSCT